MGWDVRKFDPLHSNPERLARQLAAHKADAVLDVGANAGQFAQQLRQAGFPGKIISFEATSGAHAKLRKTASRDRNWTVAPQVALGDQNGTIVFNIAGNSASSSALPMLLAHLNADPKSLYVGSETVDLRTLDSLAPQFVSRGERLFLKLDVQGFEYRVLSGAERLLPQVIGIQLELSLVPLYEGESLFHPMLHEMEARGFEPWALVPGLTDSNSGRLLQLDAVFFRHAAAKAERMPGDAMSELRSAACVTLSC